MSSEAKNATETRMVRPRGLGALEETLFERRDSYATPHDSEQRLEWIAAAADHHLQRSPVFRRLAERQGFSPNRLRTSGRLETVPLVSSGIFKRGWLPDDAVDVRLCHSSGTRGAQSVVPRDAATLERFVGTVLHGLREFQGHGNAREAIILSPRASEAGDLWFAYVLTLVELLYDSRFFVRGGTLRMEELHTALAELDADARLTIIAPPALLVDLLRWMEERSLRVDLDAADGYVVTAGGWKRHERDAIERGELDRLVHERLGIPPARVRDAFNMVELNTVLFECERRRMHIPPWLAVIARRPETLAPALSEEEGILTYLDPTATSYPAFVLSDDFGVVSHERCLCGRHGATLEIRRRLATIEERGCALKLDRDVGRR